MQDAYHRTCSHFSTRSTLGIPEGTVLRTVLTGEFKSIPVLAQKYKHIIRNSRCSMSVVFLTMPVPTAIEGGTVVCYMQVGVAVF